MTADDRDRYIRERAAAGDEPSEIVAALAERGCKTTTGKIRSLLELDAQTRRQAADSVAASQAVSGTELVIATLTELTRQGAEIARNMAALAAPENRGDDDADTAEMRAAARAWSEVTRSAVAAAHALHGIVSGQKPVTTATVEEIAKRFRAVVMGAEDGAAIEPRPSVH